MSEFSLEIASFHPYLHNRWRRDFKSIFHPRNIKSYQKDVL